MSTINERFVEAIHALGIKKTQVAKALGIADASVSNICSGKTNPSGQTVTAFCNEYGVNKEWLVNGVGEMFTPQSRGEEIGSIVKAAARHDPEQAQQFMLGLVSDLSDAEIVLLYEIFKRHFPDSDK